jgi:hypothetical protein
MTPKEKALELVQKYFKANHQPYGFKDAKQCALIAVDEIINAIDWHEFETPNKELEYWQEVKQEIEKL